MKNYIYSNSFSRKKFFFFLLCNHCDRKDPGSTIVEKNKIEREKETKNDTTPEERVS